MYCRSIIQFRCNIKSTSCSIKHAATEPKLHGKQYSTESMFRVSKRWLFDGPKVFLREVTIPNTGSAARDHLANERTFLAWARTSLALCGFGIALEALEFNTLSEYQQITPQDEDDILTLIPLFLNSRKKHFAALTCITLGGFLMTYATVRYIQVLRLLHKGQFRPNIYGILLTVGTATAIVGGGMAFIHAESENDEIITRDQSPLTSIPAPSRNKA